MTLQMSSILSSARYLTMACFRRCSSLSGIVAPFGYEHLLQREDRIRETPLMVPGAVRARHALFWCAMSLQPSAPTPRVTPCAALDTPTQTGFFCPTRKRVQSRNWMRENHTSGAVRETSGNRRSSRSGKLGLRSWRQPPQLPLCGAKVPQHWRKGASEESSFYPEELIR